MPSLRSYVTAVSLVGAHHGPEGASGQLLVVSLGKFSLGVWISMTSRGSRLNSYKGQWGLMIGASHAAAL
jgi:hypothetical protein